MQSKHGQTIFIKPKTAWKRLESARMLGQTLYIYGVTGYGKTELIQRYFDGCAYTYLSCRSGRLYEPEKKIRRNRKLRDVTDEDGAVLDTIVIDDLQFLKEEEDKEKILAMIRDEGKWVVLISRSPLLPWLKTIYMNEGIKQIKEQEMAWTKKDVGIFFLKCGQMELTEEQQEEICTFALGNPLGIRTICFTCEEHGHYDPAYLQQSWQDFEDYLIKQLMLEWDSTLIHFLMQVSFLDEITVPLAEMVTGNTDAYRLIQEALEIGNFLVKEDEDRYSLRSLLRTALQKRARNSYRSDRIRDIYYNAGLYYETNDDISNALKMYEISGNQNRIRDILIRNVKRNSGNGHYIELQKYYFSLETEDVEQDATLMTGMSMLYSILLQPEESEKWYEKLKIYERKEEGARRREARSYVMYLDIALPHRRLEEALESIRQVPKQLYEKGVSLPECTITAALPSVINGNKDFCEWSLKNQETTQPIGKEVETVLGRFGKGLVEIAQGESLYEKGGEDYEIITLLSKGSMYAVSGGTTEMIYAAIGVQCRLNMLHGNEEAAKDILLSFQKKMEKQQEKEILKNVSAQGCRIALYGGDHEVIEEWLKSAPEEEAFSILERYCYLTKVRCYMYQGEYYRAMALLEQIHFYAELYHRNYILIESRLLLSIIQYRLHLPEWQETFRQVVKRAEGYGFRRIISEEGAAVWDLLSDRSMKKLLEEECEEGYLSRLVKETHSMMLYFPMYLSKGQAETIDIKGNALAVLRLSADGFTYRQIADELGIKVETVRYHCNQNYKKLGVEGKTEAVLAARNLRIL